DALVRQMVGRLPREFLDDSVELRKFLAGEALPENGRESAGFFGEERQIALRATHIPCEDHQLPPYSHFDDLCPVQQLRVVPPSAVAFEQKIGFPRAPAPSRILWHGGAPGRAPHVEDGIHKRPRRLDGVTAVEERGVPAETIVHQRDRKSTRLNSSHGSSSYAAF